VSELAQGAANGNREEGFSQDTSNSVVQYLDCHEKHFFNAFYTAQQPGPSVQSAIANPSVFSTCLGTVRLKNPTATTARITTAMIFFMMPLLDYSTTFAAAVITFREAERTQQPVRRLTP